MKKNKKHTSKHHVCPKSRGGSNKPHNTVEVNSKKHEIYHQLFSNLKPEEIHAILHKLFPYEIANIICEHLAIYWWNARDEDGHIVTDF